LPAVLAAVDRLIICLKGRQNHGQHLTDQQSLSRDLSGDTRGGRQSHERDYARNSRLEDNHLGRSKVS